MPAGAHIFRSIGAIRPIDEWYRAWISANSRPSNCSSPIGHVYEAAADQYRRVANAVSVELGRRQTPRDGVRSLSNATDLESYFINWTKAHKKKTAPSISRWIPPPLWGSSVITAGTPEADDSNQQDSNNVWKPCGTRSRLIQTAGSDGLIERFSL